MKKKLHILLLAGLLLSFTNVFAQDPDFYIFLCFGQSNMVGGGTIEPQDQTVDSRFQTFQAVDCPNLNRMKANWYPAIPPLCRCYNGLGIIDYFGRTMVANLPSNIKVGVINVAVEGCGIELYDKDNFQIYLADAADWLKNIVNYDYDGNPYQYLINLAKLSKNYGVIKGILLHQGESNYGDVQWPAKVKTVYDDMISDLGLNAASVPLLAGQLAGGDASYMNSQIISTLPQVIPNAHVVSSNGCEVGEDGIHFTPEGSRELGRHYATEMLTLLGGCTPTTITPYVQVNDGAWQQTASVTIDAGAKVKFGPQPVSGGTWSWSGCGTSGTSREQTIYPTSSCTSIATFTNDCGALSSQTFVVNVNGSSSGQNVHLTKSNATGFAIDGNNGGANGQQIYLWANDINNVNQTWVEIDRGGGYYSYQKLNTNYCMDGGNGGANGQSVYLWACDADNQNQHWQKISAGANFRLQKRNAPGYSIDGGNGGENGQILYLWASDDNNLNQQWIFSTSSLKSAFETEGLNESLSSSVAYPNPVTNVLNVQLSAPVSELIVYSIEGKQLYSQNTASGDVEIDMSGFSAGIYVVKAIAQNETWTQKIMKQ